MALVAAIAGWAAPAVASEPSRELIYGSELMSGKEREAYRRSFERAPDEAARAQVRERHRQRLRERAGRRGVELDGPHGVLRR